MFQLAKMATKKQTITSEEIVKVISTVKDPEIQESIVDMGMIYDAKYDSKKDKIVIKMTLTTPFCPLGGFIEESIREALKKFKKDVEINIVFDPPWTIEKIKPELRAAMGF